MKTLLCLLLTVTAISGEGSTDDNTATDMCSLDQLASIMCDICQDMAAAESRDQCCADENALYACEKLIMAYEPETEEEAGEEGGENDVAGDLAEEKRAAWSWKKPTANRLNTMYDLGFRGKRYATTDRYSWKPANYRLNLYNSGYRGKRLMDEGLEDSEDSEMEKRGRWSWKPAANRLDDPYGYDRHGFFGKRFDTSDFVDDDMDFDSTAKRTRYPGRYDWKPAPYRLDSTWGYSGKRSPWQEGRPIGRYSWKPASGYGYMQKRGGWDWKPAAYRLDDPWGMSQPYRYMGKRFSVGPGRWNWKPQKSQFKSEGKRGRYDWKPSTGYFANQFSSYSSQPTGKRPRQYDWKPRSFGNIGYKK